MQSTNLQGFPLSTQQNRLWLLQENNHCILGAIQIQGALDRGRFKDAIEHVIMRNEILRTIFCFLPGMDLPMQVVSEHSLWSYTEISFEHFTPLDQYKKIDELFISLQKETYDLQQGPLVLIRLVSLNARQQVALVSLPALCADNFSLKLFINELLTAYSDYMPVEEVLQYADVSAWQDEQLLEEEAIPLREYWHRIDLSRLASMKIPFQYEAHKTGMQVKKDFSPKRIGIAIPDSLAQKIDSQASKHGISISTWLLACLNVLLWRLTHETKFLIGFASDGRNYQDLINTVGPYTRLVPVEARFEKDRPFSVVLTSVNSSLQEAIKRQLYFTEDALSDHRDNNAAKLFFPVIFEYDTYPATFESQALTLSLLKRWSCTEPFVFKLSTLQIGASIQLDLYYDSQQIPTIHADTLASLFRTLLERLIEQPQVLIGTVSLLTVRERASLLSANSGTRRSWLTQGLHQLFEEQVLRWPDAPAVISRQEQLTYLQLNARANQLAQVLRRWGVGPGRVVGLCLSRQASMLVGLLGILKAGGAYLPLDTGNPKARLQSQLQESGALLLLTQEEQRQHLPDWGSSTLYLEELAEELASAPVENQPTGSRAEDLAYIIYTSGSTGMPKGVMVSHRNVVNYAQALCEQLGAEPGWQYATVSTLAADLGNTAIFGALTSGGCVQVLDYGQITSAEAMASWAEQHPIDVLKIVPSHLSALLESAHARTFLPRRALVLGGEALSESLLERVAELGAACTVYNHYGPTETTIGVLINALGALQEWKAQDEERTIALGCPIANIQVYVLDGRMQLVPQGVIGELYIEGVGVAWGYIGQGGQTAERFVPSPYSNEKGMRLYRTGDLVRYDEQGQIEFIGRADGQVKLRGYRIEVGEIEAVLRQHPQVRESVVVLCRNGREEARLIGYVVSRQRAHIVWEQLEAWTRERLPEYMVPVEYVCLDEWPLTANGKIDRQRLCELGQGWSHAKREVAPARNPIEELIVLIWCELLGEGEIGIHDNFFALGGHSLLATRVIARIRAMLQVELPVRVVFEASTVAELARLVEQTLRGAEEMQRPPLVASERPEELPLSFAQQRLWFLDQLEPESTAYLAVRSWKVGGALAVQSLERSLQSLITRHESLRTTFVARSGQPRQIIQPEGRVSLPVIDLRGLKSERIEAEAQRLGNQEMQRPCDLTQGPLLRTHLIRLEAKKHILLFTLHHSITDGWSNEVLVRELITLYQAFVNDQPSPLAPLPIQYADYALWQQAWLRDEILEAQLTYWRKQLLDMSPLELFTDHPHLPGQTYRGAVLSIEMPEELSHALTALSQQENVTVFMLLLTALQILLMRYTGKTDISVGTPIANRMQAEVENIIGFFVNTLILRMNLAGNPTFLHLLQQVREACLGAYTHQDVPFEKVVEMLQLERDLSGPSLLQVSFELVYESDVTQLIPELSIESAGTDGASADYALRVEMIRRQQSFFCTIFYDTNLFEAQTISRFLEHFQTLLQGIVLTPEKAITLLPVLSEQELKQQLLVWNDTQQDYLAGMGVHQLFERQVERAPAAVALVFEDETLTYGALNHRANRLAHYLRHQGVGPEVLVGLCLQRSIALVIAVLAVLKAGGAYVPLDPSYPQERLALLLHDAAIPLLLTREPLRQRLPATESRVVCLETLENQLTTESDTNLPDHGSAHQLAYVLYTSGSTGRPKGVMVPRAALVNYLYWAAQTYVPSTRSRDAGVPLHSPLGFDLTVTSLFVPLLTGHKIVLLAEEEGFTSLGTALSSHSRFLLTKVTPAHLDALGPVIASNHLATSTQTLVIGGEALWHERLAPWRASAPTTRLINEYGPTETVVGCSIYEVPPQSPISGAVPIGKPIANTQLYVLDSSLLPVPIGVAAELYVGGAGVTRGYLKRPEQTAERFIPHPFSREPGARLYRTGDLARYLPSGDLEYMGRVDQQVKIRGYRIELGEIEALLGAHPAIQSAVVIVQEDRTANPYLAAYAIPDPFYIEERGQKQQAPLVEERIKHWQGLYDEIYQPRTSQAVQTFNIVGWDSSYTDQPIPTEEMQVWLEDTLALVRSYRPARIWEIGCGTGLLLFPLSLDCMHYYGTDFSAVVLESVRQQLDYLKEQQGVQTAVTLLRQQANDFSTFPQEPIDTIVINSVIQYFPGVNYLLGVLEGAVRRVAPGGRIIVGDVRSLPLLEAFHTDVQLAHASEELTRQQLWQQVHQHLQQEKELVLDPTFFRRWAQSTGRVHRVEIRLKRGRYHNELTQFRYQVVLHIGELATERSANRPLMPVEELNWFDHGLTREQLRQKLLREQPHRLRLRQVPNARVEPAIETLRWLKSETEPETVGEWRTTLHTRPRIGVDPEDLWDVAEQLGYHMTISWSQHRENGTYSVLLQRKDVEQWDDTEEELPWPDTQSEAASNWQMYANQPLQEEAKRLLIPQLRQYLHEWLPEYMVPARLEILVTFPLTPNGKLDHKALSAFTSVQRKDHTVQDGPRTPVEELIGALWDELLRCGRVGIHENFFELGGHSLLVTQLVARIRATLQVEMPVRVAFEVPTVEGMARWMEHALRTREAIETPALTAVPLPENIPLSFAQQRLWFLSQLNPNSTIYLSSEMLSLRGTLNSRALERSIQEIVHRHENLRTTFIVRTEQPVQVIHARDHFMLPIIDLKNLRPEQRVQEARALAHQESQHPCDLTTGPLFRVYLLQLEPREHLMALTLHHIITDGWSYEVLVHEISILYQSYSTEQPSPLVPLPIQYAHYALWQRQWLQGKLLQRHIAYWQQQLRGVSLLELPTDAPRPAESDAGARYSFELAADLSTALVSLSRREGVTLFMTLLSAFQILLYRLSGQMDVVVGTDVANRTQVETEELIGFFINLVALRTKLQGTLSFREVIQQVRVMVLDAYAHQELPFELVIEHVYAKRIANQTPIVQVLCVMQNTPKSAFSLPDLELETIDAVEPTARFDLALFLQEEANGIRGSVVYRTELFQERTIASWMDQFDVLLNSIVAQPDMVIDMLEIYTEKEKAERTKEKVARSHVEARRIRATKNKGFEISAFNQD